MFGRFVQKQFVLILLRPRRAELFMRLLLALVLWAERKHISKTLRKSRFLPLAKTLVCYIAQAFFFAAGFLQFLWDLGFSQRNLAKFKVI